MAVGVVRHGRTVFAEAYGVRDAKKNLRATVDTGFYTASCTKAFTATSVAILVDEGLLDWDVPVREYLPGFRLADAFATERCTLRDVLCHRTGLARHDWLWLNSQASRMDIFKALRHLPPTADFRSAFQYNNLAYILAGAVVEHVAGMPWEEFVRERILTPLRMTSTGFITDEPSADRNAAVAYDAWGGTVRPYFRTWMAAWTGASINGPCGPAGSIVSTAPDLCKWVAFQMSDGMGILSASTLRELHTPHMTAPGWYCDGRHRLDASYGLGWFTQAYRGYRCVFHDGGFRGFVASVSFLPSESLGVVVLANLEPSPINRVAPFSIFDRLLGLTRVSWHGQAKREAEERAEARRQSNAAKKAKGVRLPRPARVYAGTYHHPAYGPLVIDAAGGKLALTYNGFPFRIVPAGGDDVVLKCKGRAIEFGASFQTGKRGRVQRIAVGFERAVAPVVFTQKKRGA